MGDEGGGQLPAGRTLAARAADRDRHRFVGRADELAFLESCLGDDPPASVVLVCGPGGIGKSTLLRELARRASALGWDVIAVDGRELAPAPGTLEASLAAGRASARPLVLIDSYERMAALGAYLRTELVPALPGRALVVIAGRGTPDPAWLAGRGRDRPGHHHRPAAGRVPGQRSAVTVRAAAPAHVH